VVRSLKVIYAVLIKQHLLYCSYVLSHK